MEERAGRGDVLLFRLPLSSVLSPRVPRGRGRKAPSFETVSAAASGRRSADPTLAETISAL